MTAGRGALPVALDKPHAAAFHDGPAHIVRYANPAFEAEFGSGCVGMPAREAMPSLPSRAFGLMDRVLRDGKPLATRIRVGSDERRLVVVPRIDPDGEVYGVTTHLVHAGWTPQTGRQGPHAGEG